ncbi:MAG: MOSC domain-containing protein [Acidimicrobiia bacterium]|nr:MAG: MOSC domain-containing protein [Acidimicrobiia bacterium]
MDKIISVNVGEPRSVEYRGRIVSTGIYKYPVQGAVRVEGVNLDGDNQADRRVHGGFDKAVYAYAAEDYEWWSEQLGRTLLPGTFGDNLTTTGIDVGAAVVGQLWRIGDVALEVSEPRVPCYKLGIRMEDPGFPKVFSAADRPGAYLRIVEEGSLAAGDRIEIGSPPPHDLTVADIARIHNRDQHEAGRLLEAAQLSEPWQRWARSLAQV